MKTTNGRGVMMRSPLEARARRAAGDWFVSMGPFDVFATLTFRHDVQERVGHKSFRRYLNLVAQTYGDHFPVVWAWGPQLSGRLHFHALARATGKPLGREDFAIVPWPGNVEFDPPREQKKSALYVARREHDNWMVGTVCTRAHPCRRRGCIVAGSSWPPPEECIDRWS